MIPCCHSALSIAPQCSSARISLFVALVNQVKPHMTMLTWNSPSLVEGRFSWQAGAFSSWRRKLIYQQEYSLPIKAINKTWSKSLPKSGPSSQKGDNVADTGLIPPCWYKLWSMLTSCLVSIGGEKCSDWHRTDSFPYPWQPLLSHTHRMIKSSSTKVLPKIRSVQATVGLKNSS